MTGEVKRYEIDRISDLLAVPADRRAACFRQLEYALAVHELAFGEQAMEASFTVTWTDDDSRSVSAIANGEPLLSLNIDEAMRGGNGRG